MKKPIKFIYFDIGGVLLDWRGGYTRVAKKYGVSEESLYKVLERHWEKAARGQLTGLGYMAEYAKILGLNPPFPSTSDFWSDHYAPIVETHALVRELQSTYTLGLLSNAEDGSMKYAMQKGLIPSISWHTIIDSSAVGVVKPEARIFELAEQASGVSPEEMLFIDDVEEYIAIVKSRGWQGMVFDTNNIASSVKNIRDALGI